MTMLHQFNVHIKSLLVYVNDRSGAISILFFLLYDFKRRYQLWNNFDSLRQPKVKAYAKSSNRRAFSFSRFTFYIIDAKAGIACNRQQ